MPSDGRTIVVSGAQFQADWSGALWWKARSLLAVADLHFEKGSAFAARTGQFLPPYDTHATLARLTEVVDRLAPKIVMCLGDNFHDGDGPERLDRAARASIQVLMRSRRFIWIEGNHDQNCALKLGGESAPEFELGGITFRHEPSIEPALGEVCGHLHPAASIETRALTVRRRCFVSDASRCILPSFGAYTGGLDVFDPAIRNHFRNGFMAHLLGPDRVYAFSHSRLAGAYFLRKAGSN